MSYQTVIRELDDRPGVRDPRHVQAFLMLEHGTLASLTSTDFAAGIERFDDFRAAAGAAECEELARSFGL